MTRETVTIYVPSGYASSAEFLKDCGFEPAQCAPQPSREPETCVVPLNPTEDMLKAARNAWFLPDVGPYYTGYTHIYRAMLGAAPAVITLKIDVARTPPDDDPHGDGHCGCTERCKDRDNCQYDTPQAPPAVSCAAREAIVKVLEDWIAGPAWARERAADAILALPAAGGEASKREAEIVERCANIAEAIDSGRGNEKQIAAAIRASLRKDG